MQAFEEGLDHHYPHLIPEDKTSLLIFRMGYRTVNTVVVSLVAASVPHFSVFAGLIGALTFWPLSGRPAERCCVPSCMEVSCLHLGVSMHNLRRLSDGPAAQCCIPTWDGGYHLACISPCHALCHQSCVRAHISSDVC